MEPTPTHEETRRPAASNDVSAARNAAELMTLSLPTAGIQLELLTADRHLSVT
jgi:hypothetical protein